MWCGVVNSCLIYINNLQAKARENTAIYIKI
nr:MAG TPA: hypothetical protein [Caudoviricetes sp.]